ncbi:hypothetical protein POV27_11495 [Aureisphaera galaxeae]|uniref:hypothetical protein n=1 Tax=Aureisphaera galaxeae TaxID=1538023 RepID=UPI00234FEB22|nr:hypothetical protein [Aureisphaera galaxeae]MDC8004676.1 hypothetical protein [Aureisphaera galaxeae]
MKGICIPCYLFVFLFFCQTSELLCQDRLYIDPVRKDSTIREHKKTIYHLVQTSWDANQAPSYASLAPYVSSIDTRRIPLVQGEGANSNFDVLEANLNLNFPLFFGRESGTGLAKRHRLDFDYNGNFRMSLDDSKPILPGSHKVGFSWYINLYNNYTGSFFADDETKAKINATAENLKFYNATIRVHHYSNGQAPGFFYPSDSLPPIQRRNAYSNGDFSTNYIYVACTKGWYNKVSLSLHQLSLGYRTDLGTETSIFAYSQQQENSYGRHRLLASYDYRTNRFGMKKDWHVRTEVGYILGNLDNFIPNLANDTNKYRLSARGLIEFSPKAHRAIGYMFFLYYGRDYLNIRYDDIVVSAQFGVTLRIDKFFMPKLRD